MSSDFNIDFDQGSGLGTMDVYADIVYCIDLTSSMKPIIDKVKEMALTLHEDLQQVMQTNYQRSIKQLRIKVIGFRDAYCDGPRSFEVSEFFTMPDEVYQFQEFVNRLEAKGGGDLPENSLEALAMAMQSDWCTTIDSSIRKRHLIVLFTDASAHPLEQSENGTDKYYPANMPKSYGDLVDWWEGQGSLDSGAAAVRLDQIAKRLAVYAPENSEPWSNLVYDFTGAKYEPIEPGNGGRDIKTESLLKILGETMA